MIPEGYDIISYANNLLDRSVDYVISALTQRMLEASVTHEDIRFAATSSSAIDASVQLVIIGRKKK
jgi:hypothetical protein